MAGFALRVRATSTSAVQQHGTGQPMAGGFAPSGTRVRCSQCESYRRQAGVADLTFDQLAPAHQAGETSRAWVPVSCRW